MQLLYDDKACVAPVIEETNILSKEELQTYIPSYGKGEKVTGWIWIRKDDLRCNVAQLIEHNDITSYTELQYSDKCEVNVESDIIKKGKNNVYESIRTHVSTTLNTTKDEKGKSVDKHKCKSMIDMCARYQTDHNESYKKVVKRVMTYVNSTTYYGLFYNIDTTTHLVGYGSLQQETPQRKCNQNHQSSCATQQIEVHSYHTPLQ